MSTWKNSDVGYLLHPVSGHEDITIPIKVLQSFKNDSGESCLIYSYETHEMFTVLATSIKKE